MAHKRHLTFPGLMALALVLATAACGSAASTPTASQGPATTLRLGFLPNLTHAPLLVGLKSGSYAAALGTTTLKVSPFNAGPEAVTALLSNSVDAAYLGPNPAVNAFVQSHGTAVRLIAGATSGGAGLVVRPGLNSAADLRGKTIATPQVGNTQDVALRWWLQSAGLKVPPQGGGDVNVIAQDNAQTLQTFRSGQIDGAWVPEPWLSRLLIEGGGKLLVDERSLWPHGRFATTVLVVRTDFLRAHPETVRALLEAHVTTLETMAANPAAAQRTANDELGDLTGKKLADPVVAAAWERLSFTADPGVASIGQSADHAFKVGLLAKVDLKGLTDLTLLNQVLAAHHQPSVAGA